MPASSSTISLTKRCPKKSFSDLKNWKEVFINQGSVKDPTRFPFLIVGNKCDLEVG